MRKLILLFLASVMATLVCQALTVNNTAGGLAQAVGDNTDITTLVVSGTMDASDFLFITNELNELISVDLSQATIVAYQGGKTLYGTTTNYRADEIPRTAFFGKKLTSVVMPAGVQTIGFAAFAGCNELQSVSLPASVSMIDDYAFAGTGLTSVVVPSTVAYMGKGVFSRCEVLETAVINTQMLGDFAFLGDVKLRNVQIGANVGYILKGVFNGCTALTTVNFDPACSLNRIDEEAFINSGLETIDLNSLNVGTIGDWALAQTHLATVQLPDGMTQLGEGALAHNPSLTSVIFPGLGHNNGGTRFNAPSKPRTLVRVNDYTFADNDMLNVGMMLKNGVAHIGNYVFYNNSREMDTVYLPSTVAYLGDFAMAGMTGMKCLKTDAADVPGLGENVWAGVDQPSVLLVTPSAESTKCYQAADQWMYFFFAPVDDDYILGDVNGDGIVSIIDVTALIDYLLGASDIDVNEKAADMNVDGTVSITDVTALIDYLLGVSASKSRSHLHRIIEAQTQATSDVLSIEAISLKAGSTCIVDVALNNDEHQYMALQCELALPQGVELVDVKGIDRGNKHVYYSIKHEVEENVYTIIGVSNSLDHYAGNEGNVVQLILRADDDFSSKGSELELSNVQLVTPQHLAYLAANAMAQVVNPSGIENITAGKQVADVRYINVAGQESKTPFDGVNIVVTTYTDGSTSTIKVMK